MNRIGAYDGMDVLSGPFESQVQGYKEGFGAANLAAAERREDAKRHGPGFSLSPPSGASALVSGLGAFYLKAMQAACLSDRAVLAVSGVEARDFLQGLVTNDMEGLQPGAARYAALLTPQGKILFEFLVYTESSETFLIDCAASRAAELAKRLTLYRLRAKIVIAARPDLGVAALWDGAPPQTDSLTGCFIFEDPRLPALGWRAIGASGTLSFAQGDEAAYRAHRIALGVPDTGDLPPDQIFALDAGFEELNGVSFKKGCYVGQEVTARMKHRTSARRRFLIATGDALPSGTPIMAGAKEIGTLGISDGAHALAHIRLDRWADATSNGSPLEADGRKISLEKPSWLKM